MIALICHFDFVCNLLHLSMSNFKCSDPENWVPRATHHSSGRCRQKNP